MNTGVRGGGCSGEKRGGLNWEIRFDINTLLM